MAGEFVWEDGTLQMVSCPQGALLVNSSVDAQRCRRCEPLTYSFHFLDHCVKDGGTTICPERECLPCPLGALCEGANSFEPLVDGSEWVLEAWEGAMAKRLVRCPPGFILVSLTDKPALDQCVECPRGTYSVQEATFNPPVLISPASENASNLCQECEDGAECPGGNLMTPKKDFWILPEERGKVNASRAGSERARVVVYQCQRDACLGTALSACEKGRIGPICGLCAQGWTRSGSSCVKCGNVSSDAVQYAMLVLLVAGILLLFYYVSWKPFMDFDASADTGSSCTTCWRCSCCCSGFQASGSSAMRRLVLIVMNSPATAYLKILVGFFQVVGSYEASFAVKWPDDLRKLWSWASVLRFEALDIPGISCLAARMSFFQKLQFYTLTPVAVSILLLVPTLVLFVRGETNTPRFKAVNDRFWFAWMLWLFLLYPTVSIRTIQAFRCTDIGGQYLLVADLSELCPYNDWGSITLWWSIIFCVIVPLGIPLSTLFVLWWFRIPQMATFKRENGLFREMVQKFRVQTETTLAFRLVSYIGGGKCILEDRALMEERARRIFDAATQEGSVTITHERMLEYLDQIGLHGDHSQDLTSLMLLFDSNDDGSLDWDEFWVMVQTLMYKESLILGTETMKTIQDEALDELCAHDWKSLIYDGDSDEETGLEREVKRRIRRQIKNQTKKLPRLLRRYSSGASFTTFTSSNLNSPFASRGSGLASRSLPFGSQTILSRNANAASQGASGTLLLSQTSSSTNVGHSRRTVSLDSALTEDEDVDAGNILFAELPPNPTRKDKLDWILKVGRQLRFKKVIAVSQVKWDGSTEEEREIMDRIGFLCDAYKMEFWYFEILEMARKFVRTGLIVFLYPGSPEQLTIGLLLSMLALTFFLKSKPYVQKSVDNMQSISLGTQAATLMYGMVLAFQRCCYSQDETDSGGLVVLGVIVIILNISIFVLPVLLICYEEREALGAALHFVVRGRSGLRHKQHASASRENQEGSHSPRLFSVTEPESPPAVAESESPPVVAESESPPVVAASTASDSLLTDMVPLDSQPGQEREGGGGGGQLASVAPNPSLTQPSLVASPPSMIDPQSSPRAPNSRDSSIAPHPLSISLQSSSITLQPSSVALQPSPQPSSLASHSKFMAPDKPDDDFEVGSVGVRSKDDVEAVFFQEQEKLPNARRPWEVAWA